MLFRCGFLGVVLKDRDGVFVVGRIVSIVLVNFLCGERSWGFLESRNGLDG